LPAAAAKAPRGSRGGGPHSGSGTVCGLATGRPSRCPTHSSGERFGIWVMIERESGSVVGDIGFIGPPTDGGSIEIGYSVTPARRRRGYATEAARAILDWALRQPEVKVLV